VIAAEQLVGRLAALGVRDVAGVPCSYLTPVINNAIGNPLVRYVPVSQEGEAVSIAAGAWLGGGLGCAIAQNSGLGNMVGPLTSLLYPARIPALLVVTWRGRPGERDEPQHALMGAITPGLLDLMGLGHEVLPAEPESLDAAFASAEEFLRDESLPYAFVLAQQTVRDEELDEPVPVGRSASVHRYGPGIARPSRRAALERILATVPERAAVISTTGWTSRELYALDDRPQHFYLVGAMGSAATVGLGVARHTDRPVVVVDGDAAVMMRLGGLATVAAASPPGLIHVVLDNGVHESTGGQYSLAPCVELPAVAAACGYAEVHACGGLDDLEEALREGLAGGGPTFVHVPISPGRMEHLPRPAIGPADVARRFRDFVTAGEPVKAEAPLLVTAGSGA
jgi:phosphonopyruvate decarboxylase